MAINLTDPIFTDETKAREHLENIRWPEAVSCVHCGGLERVYKLADTGNHRPGLFHCNDCGGSFTVTTGTVMESSHVPLNKWVLAYRLMASAKKGISAHQLHRTIGVTYKTAWFMAHRIRESMRDTSTDKLGGEGSAVEMDETYVGGKPKKGGKPTRKGRGTKKVPLVVLVEREGRARTVAVPDATTYSLRDAAMKHIDPASTLMTDEYKPYVTIGRKFAGHKTVKHGDGEYARGDANVNSAEAFFSLLKRSIIGSFHHVSPEHLDRYADEVAFRWSHRHVDDTTRADLAVKGGEGKRLTYRQPR